MFILSGFGIVDVCKFRIFLSICWYDSCEFDESKFYYFDKFWIIGFGSKNLNYFFNDSIKIFIVGLN